LHGGQKVVQILLQAADGARPRNAGGQHLLNARVANGNQRKLGSHKKGIGQNQHGHGDKFEQRKTVHLGVRIAFQGTGVREQGSGTKGLGTRAEGFEDWEPN
jgi:hypothetical protein